MAASSSATPIPTAPKAKSNPTASLPMSKWPTKRLTGHRGHVPCLGWSCDGRRLATGSMDKSVRIYTPERSGTTSSELKGHTSPVTNLKWSPRHNDHLATGASDKTVCFWDIRQSKSAGSVTCAGEIINVCYSPDGNTVAAGDRQDNVKFIDVRKKEVIGSWKCNDPESQVNELMFSPTGALLFVTMGLESMGYVKIFRYPDMTEYHSLFGHTASAMCLDLDNSSRFLAVGGSDALVSIWDTHDWLCLRTYSDLDFAIRTISISRDGNQYVAAGSEDPKIDIFSSQTAKLVHRIPVTSPTSVLSWHPSKSYLAYTSEDQNPALRVNVFGL